MSVSIPCPSDTRGEDDRRAFEQTGNPLHVWNAIAQFGLTEPLPLWVRDHLLAAAHNLVEVERAVADGQLSPQEATKVLPRALGFTSQGKNMFDESKRLHGDSMVSLRYHLDQFTSPKKPRKAIVEDLKLSRRTAKRKIDKVHRITGYPKTS